jgi:hypothetical protein
LTRSPRSRRQCSSFTERTTWRSRSITELCVSFFLFFRYRISSWWPYLREHCSFLRFFFGQTKPVSSAHYVGRSKCILACFLTAGPIRGIQQDGRAMVC